MALNDEDLLRSGCLKVDVCAGHEHDVTMDEVLDEADFDDSDDYMSSGGEISRTRSTTERASAREVC